MSNVWKVFGLACVSEAFLKAVTELKPGLTAEADYHKRIVMIDNLLLGQTWRIPVGHLEIQLIHDAILLDGFWDPLKTILGASPFGPLPADKDKLHADEYYRVIGLCCVDPWKQEGVDMPGFRDSLRTSVDANKTVSDAGFLLDPNDAVHIQNGLKAVVPDPPKLAVSALMDTFSMRWDDITLNSIQNRDQYGPLIVTPPGWVTIPAAGAPAKKPSRSE
jgi:hypothetical protein